MVPVALSLVKFAYPVVAATSRATSSIETRVPACAVFVTEMTAGRIVEAGEEGRPFFHQVRGLVPQARVRSSTVVR